MPTYYLDPESGNDASNGTTFANRWKTLTAGATAARLGSGGGDIRIMASRTPIAQGATAFVNGTDIITLPAAKTMVIDDCDTVWTAGTNVTTETSYKRESTISSIHLMPNGSFGGGKVAYHSLPSALNLSGYESISFMVFSNGGNYPNEGQFLGTWSLQLCSDTLGNTVVHTIPIVAQTNRWCAVYFDNATALSSNIQSLSIISTSGLNSTDLYVDNIIAVKHKDNANHLCHNCVVGKNTVSEPEWYPIVGIDGPVLKTRIMNNPLSQAATSSFFGATENVTGYTMHPTPTLASADWVLQAGGTLATTPVRLSGGWDRSAMTTQTGATWFSGYRTRTTGLNLNDKSGVITEKLGFVGYTNPFTYGTTAAFGTDTVIGLDGVVDSFGTVFSSGLGGTGQTKITCPFINGTNGAIVASELVNCQGLHDYILPRLLNSASISPTLIGGYGHKSKRWVTKVIGNYSVVIGSQLTQLSSDVDPSRQFVRLSNTTFVNCNSAGAGNYGSGNSVGTIFENCVGTGIVWYATTRPLPTGFNNDLFQTSVSVQSTNHEGDPNSYFLEAGPDSRGGSTMHGRSGHGFYVQTSQTEYIPLATIAVKAGALTTVNASVKSILDLYYGLTTALQYAVRPMLCTRASDGFPGVGDNFVSPADPFEVDTWQPVSLSFTPTATGMVTIYVKAGASLTDPLAGIGFGTTIMAVVDELSYSSVGGVLTTTPITLLPKALAPVPPNVAYSVQLVASNGSAPYSYTLSGTLPTGLTLSSTGLLSGTPTTVGSTTFTVQVTDSQGVTLTKAYNLTIQTALN